MSYIKKLKFAKSLGFNDVTTAMNKLGKQLFDLKYSIFEVEKTTMKGINENYTIYPNGVVFSSYYNGTFLKPYKQKKHYTYRIRDLNSNKSCGMQIPRLVMFYFGKHNYKSIYDMPKIILIDGVKNNFNIENLRFEENNEIIKKVLSKKTSESNCKIKNDQENIDFVKLKLKEGKTRVWLGKFFNCNAMSVTRFIRRNNITI